MDLSPEEDWRGHLVPREVVVGEDGLALNSFWFPRYELQKIG